MFFLKQVGRATLTWVAANPAKAAQLAIALALLGLTLATEKRLNRRALKRVARVFL